jgi:hypothetical protein
VPISHRRQKHREEEELVDLSSSRVEDAPKKPDCRFSPEQMNSRTTPVLEPALPIPVRARTETEMAESNSTVNW